MPLSIIAQEAYLCKYDKMTKDFILQNLLQNE